MGRRDGRIDEDEKGGGDAEADEEEPTSTVRARVNALGKTSIVHRQKDVSEADPSFTDATPRFSPVDSPSNLSPNAKEITRWHWRTNDRNGATWTETDWNRMLVYRGHFAESRDPNAGSTYPVPGSLDSSCIPCGQGPGRRTLTRTQWSGRKRAMDEIRSGSILTAGNSFHRNGDKEAKRGGGDSDSQEHAKLVDVSHMRVSFKGIKRWRLDHRQDALALAALRGGPK
ncbi:hypothetical protein R3P38DRAFT_3449261 [Favolaschia claudopus]|uniref:Uncharacterized protein n=1 Tax=Favolaschia claudopus TaxID=2862362 RepID=A0AAW0CUE0_9AGAR